PQSGGHGGRPPRSRNSGLRGSSKLRIWRAGSADRVKPRDSFLCQDVVAEHTGSPSRDLTDNNGGLRATCVPIAPCDLTARQAGAGNVGVSSRRHGTLLIVNDQELGGILTRRIPRGPEDFATRHW